MTRQQSQSFFAKTVSIAIASASLLVSVPTFAEKPHHTPSTRPTHSAPRSQAATAPGTIVEVASKSGQFKTLVAAVKAAGLVETLSGQGPFTVFAPTDAAFAKLPKGTLAKLLKPENKETLTKILTYHVVSGAVVSKDIKPGEVKTIEGNSVKLTVKKGRVKVDKARVIKADVKTSNGVRNPTAKAGGFKKP